ncbi:unnamed protein product [Trypanosoma congolense IL3000]|uniref:WGS project CAEQ00000000 data, annotated contig 841 n=1 Tax=Trypanosoma congolense (strain IL3000) TaxID=1068625 RepID=F9WIX0_TRYCI|nr:unnamed protein product [Trypanosoma congolense IL3000]
MSFATLLRCAGVVEQQIHMIEGAVGEQLLEATLQQRKVQQLLLAERKTHEEELLDMRRTVTETNEAKLRLEEKLATLDGLYNQLVHAIKCQCRHLLSVTGGGKRGVEGKPASENSQREIDGGEMECELEGNDEEENVPVEFCERGHDHARAKSRIAAVSKAQRCEDVTLVVPDKSLQALLHRSQEAVRRFVKEVCTTQSASATQLASERQRHQTAVRKLRASLKLTQETVAELQTKLSAAQTECESARRRAEESEAAAQVRAKQNRQLQQDLAAQQRNYEAQRLVAEKCARDVAALEAQLTGRREEQFEMSVLRGRCDDLMKMITALEQRVQREEKSKFFLYEMIRCCCGALAALSLQLRTTAAERRGMVFAYDGLCEERHTVLLLLQEMKEELEKEDTGSRQVYEPHPVPHGRMYSLFALASTVIASVRMLRLAACRRGKRRVTFEVDSGPVHGSEDNSFKTAHRAFGCPDRLPSSSGLRGVIQNNPVVSALLHRRDLVNVVQKVQIPPLPTLLSHFSSAVEGSVKIECTQLLHYLMDTASLDISRLDCPHYITSHTTDWRGVLLKGAPRLRYREITESNLCTATTKLLREVFFLARCRIGQLKDEQEQGRHAIRRAFAEQCEITAKLHESKHVALSHLQEQHEYETRNAIDQATREVQQELQQRLDDMYANFQKEREARRKVEEANAILQMREVELLSAAHNMRYEIRSLSMELAEQGQRQRQRPPGERHASMNATYNCDRSCSGGDGHSFSLYRPRSVQFADDN